MSLLSPEYTVQTSAEMKKALESIHAWIAGEKKACIVVGPPGSGKSHLLNSTAQELIDPLFMPPHGSDCSVFINQIKLSSAKHVIADDLHLFAKALSKDVINYASKSNLPLLASVTTLPSYILGSLKKCYPDFNVIDLTDTRSRHEDVLAFLLLWTSINGIDADEQTLKECSDYCCASVLPKGFQTVEKFLEQMAESGWEFQGPLPSVMAASAYREATLPPPTKPVILVEGYSDRVYFEWLIKGFSSSPDVEIRDCDSATNVMEQSIALRNQAKPYVAVFDSDDIGRKFADDLKKNQHPVVLIPLTAVSLPDSAYDHVKRVAEIEDLLPVEIVEKFLNTSNRKPELEIRSPIGVRYVIDKSDKRALALWVVDNVECSKVPKLSDLLKSALRGLNIRI